MKKILFTLIGLLLCSGHSFAEKITILYTGQTHAALYHCACPKEPDGGVARRMAKVRELRLENPSALLIDAGSLFAGGAYDEHGQGIELDKLRTEINLKALEIMGYDALAISDEELNFGKDYLQEKIKQCKVPFLSANLGVEGAKPYILKKVGNTNIAIIGLTHNEAKVKSAGIALEDATVALTKTIQEVKKNKADFILVLSNLGEEKDKELLNQVKGIDILICGRYASSPDEPTKIGSSFLVRPVWQGRRLSKVDLELENSQIKDLKLEQIRLSDRVPDAPEILKILPQCFADSDCHKTGLKGHCNNPAKPEAVCSYDKPKNIPLLIINPNGRPIPNLDNRISGPLKSIFPGLELKFIDYDSKIGKSLVEKAQAMLLPVYLLPKYIENEKDFSKIKEDVELRGEYYYLKPRFSGGSLFAGRRKIFKKLDVFMGSKGENIAGVLAVLKELHARHRDVEINMHFLAIEAKNGFGTPSGLAELEEDLRQVCVRQYYPDQYWNYALCRGSRQESSWWDVCAEKAGVNTTTIKKCSLSEEGINFLRENIKLNQELQIAAGPTFLVNNYEVFAITGVPQIGQIEKMLGIEEVKK